MNKAFGWLLLTSISLASISAIWVVTRRADTALTLRPTEVASDDFDVWTQGAAWPEGLSVQNPDDAVLTSFRSSADSLEIWYVTAEPTQVPDGFETKPAYGGWLVGADLSLWVEKPGEMARRWQPRAGGTNRLERLGAMHWRSSHQPDASVAPEFYTDWTTPARSGIDHLTLPTQWVDWSERLFRMPLVVQVDAGAFPLTDWPQQDSIVALAQAAWLECRLADGTVLQALAGFDSLQSVAWEQGRWEAGIWYRTVAGEQTAWDDYPTLDEVPMSGERASAAAVDFVHRTSAESWLGEYRGGDRLVWKAKRSGSNQVPSARPEAQAARPSVAPSSLLGTARNHRTGKSMELHWVEGAVEARSGSEVVWRWPIESEKAPRVWEVDLYRNGKYQVAIGAGQRFVLVDVLGRAVNGFPKRWTEGFSAFDVVDYDRNRQYRFLLATPSGELFNFKEEGERTAGWRFKPQPGRHIVALAHLRIGPRDYIYAGQDDGSMRFLKRTGEDRFSSPVVIPVLQEPAFRLGADMASSTILYIDDEGWLQEQTLGTGEFTGISRMTRGQSVRVEDRDGDGIPEVVVTAEDGSEEIWNARNERMSANSIAED